MLMSNANASSKTYEALPDRDLRILLIDSDLVFQSTLTILLQPRCAFYTASTASLGLYLAHTIRPDIVVVDDSLPDIDGTSYVHLLRNNLPQTPILGLRSGSSSRSVSGWFQKDIIDGLVNEIAALARIHSYAIDRFPQLNSCLGRSLYYIYENHSRTLTVSSVAEASMISSHRLAQLFRTNIGLSVQRFLTGLRVELVKKLLASSDESLEVLSEQVGFCDASHLSRVFQRQIGIGPGTYRRMHKETTEPSVRTLLLKNSNRVNANCLPLTAVSTMI